MNMGHMVRLHIACLHEYSAYRQLHSKCNQLAADANDAMKRAPDTKACQCKVCDRQLTFKAVNLQITPTLTLKHACQSLPLLDPIGYASLEANAAL